MLYVFLPPVFFFLLIVLTIYYPVWRKKSEVQPREGELMRSFYHFMMTYRGRKKPTDESQLADWMFGDHNFPKHSSSYDEISEYLEWNSPFHGALQVFDRLWRTYETTD